MSNRRLLFVEFVVVVIGVMVALAADAAIGRMRDRASTREALEALRQDLVADSMQLARAHMPGFAEVAASRERFGSFLLEGGPIQDSLAFLEDLRGLSMYVTFDANRAAFDELTNSGRLTLIRDATLRDAILRYYTTVADVAELDLSLRGEVVATSSRLIPRMVGGLAWDQVALGEDPVRIREAAAIALDGDAIRQSGALRELLVSTTTLFTWQRFNYRRLVEHGNAVLALLDGTLAN